MSKIHAYMKQRFNMNTYELAGSLMLSLSPLHLHKAQMLFPACIDLGEIFENLGEKLGLF